MTAPVVSRALQSYTEEAYFNYAMYVILDRALPHLADGLKPVQRRIIYAMSELGLAATAKYKKSARTVGDVLGKFHPHGDQACYEAMVLMAQPFSYRYPFVDGQGNWGSQDDPKSFAAMRYTEAKLAPYAGLLLSELEQGTVDWVDNFDATLKEPSLLPAQVPNVLLNGATGIAVGMAADLLPHNLREVLNACLLLLENPAASLADICEKIAGPDFPTEAEIITPKQELVRMYEQGSGSVRMRAVYTSTDDQIVIHALPYQVSGAKVLEQIAAQMQQKRLPMIQDLRDESDSDCPTRLVIILRSKEADVQSLMMHLFVTTDLERSYRVNMNVIGLDGKPAVKSLKTVLDEWLQFRLSTVRRRLVHRLEKIEERLHLLGGLLIAHLNIDEVIRIIREEEDPHHALMTRFQLSERQATAILELRLKHLARLEEVKLKAEQDELALIQQELRMLLASDQALKLFLKDELKDIAKRYGDPRRSPIIEHHVEAQRLKEEEVIVDEPMTILLSEKSWIKAVKGFNADLTAVTYKAGDQFKMKLNARKHEMLYFFDTTGRVYSLAAHSIPSGKGHGEPLSLYFNMPEGAKMMYMLHGAPLDWVILASSQGYGFCTQLGELDVKARAGKACVNLSPGATLLSPQIMGQTLEGSVVCVSKVGRLLLFPMLELAKLARGKGTKLMGLQSNPAKGIEETLSLTTTVMPGQALLIHAGKRYFQLSSKDLARYTSSRGKRGALLPRGLQGVTAISRT